MTLHDLAVMTFAALCLAAVIMIAAIVWRFRRTARPRWWQEDEPTSDYQPPLPTLERNTVEGDGFTLSVRGHDGNVIRIERWTDRTPVTWCEPMPWEMDDTPPAPINTEKEDRI